MSLRECEMCGAPIRSGGRRVKIEGTIMSVCPKCIKYGTPIDDEPIVKPHSYRQEPQKPKKAPERREVPRPATRRTVRREDMMLREDYHIVIRNAREKKNLSVEDLSAKLRQSPALMKRVEAGRLKPTDSLISALERELNIKLLVDPDVAYEEEEFRVKESSEKETTLGDIVSLRKRRKRG